MKITRLSLALICISSILPCLVADALGARGQLMVDEGVNGGYPNDKWEITKQFCSMYGFGYNSGPTPSIFSGHSAAGNGAYAKAAKNASSTLCATPSGWKHDAPNAAVKNIPIFTMTGDGDFGGHDISMAQQANADGARECVALHMGHEHNFSEPDLVFLFYAECIRLRYAGSSLVTPPRNQGWLGDMSLASRESFCPYIAAFNEYKRDKSIAGWFPTRYFAFCWRAYVQSKGRTAVSSALMSRPVKSGMWVGWPTYNSGDSVIIQGSYQNSAAASFVFYDGDIPIKTFTANAYGVYQTKWKATPGFRALLGVAYNKENQPIASTRPCPVIVKGTVALSPVDNSPMENPVPFYGKTSTVHPFVPLVIESDRTRQSFAVLASGRMVALQNSRMQFGSVRVYSSGISLPALNSAVLRAGGRAAADNR